MARAASDDVEKEKKAVKYLTLADSLVDYLANAISAFPDGFYDSMSYTCTGQNLTHPITWGLLAKFAWERIEGVVHVGVDVRFNTGTGKKFQPDVVAYGGEITTLSPLLFIDYESPNSSDGRPLYKDIDAYLAWSKETKSDLPYIVITTLPDKAVTSWSKWECGKDYEAVKHSPYAYWYPWYKDELAKKQVGAKNIAFINFDGRRVKREFPAQSSRGYEGEFPCPPTASAPSGPQNGL